MEFRFSFSVYIANLKHKTTYFNLNVRYYFTQLNMKKHSRNISPTLLLLKIYSVLRRADKILSKQK